VSRTVTPILCVKILRPEDESEHGLTGRLRGSLRRFFDGIDHRYEGTIRFALRHRATVALATFALFALVVTTVAPRIGTDFFPDPDESQFSLLLKLPVGTRVERTEDVLKQLEKDFEEAVGAEYIQSMVDTAGIPAGRSAVFTANSGPHAGSIQVNLVPPTHRP